MITEALCIVAQNWRQPKCPSTSEWTDRGKYIQSLEYYLAIKRNQLIHCKLCMEESQKHFLSESHKIVYTSCDIFVSSSTSNNDWIDLRYENSKWLTKAKIQLKNWLGWGIREESMAKRTFYTPRILIFQKLRNLHLNSVHTFYINYVSKTEIYKYYYFYGLLHNHLHTSSTALERPLWWFWSPQLTLPGTTIVRCHFFYINSLSHIFSYCPAFTLHYETYFILFYHEF